MHAAELFHVLPRYRMHNFGSLSTVLGLSSQIARTTTVVMYMVLVFIESLFKTLILDDNSVLRPSQPRDMYEQQMIIIIIIIII